MVVGNNNTIQGNSSMSQAPWDEDPPVRPRPDAPEMGVRIQSDSATTTGTTSSGNSSNPRGRSLFKNGERRGSSGGSRVITVTDSRESFQSEGNVPAKKPLREALKFDLTQPWQRSLLRDLEQIESQMQEGGTELRPRPHPDRILLGRAESGDFMLECEDDYSTCTDASSTCPTRMQLVHRHQFPMRPRPEGQHDQRNGSPTPDPTTNFYDIRTISPRSIHDETDLSLERSMPSAPSIPYLTNNIPKKGEESNTSNKNNYTNDQIRPIPHALPRGRTLSHKPVSAELHRTNAFSDEAKPSNASRTIAEDDAIDYTDPACMCMGYASLIDLLMFNEPSAVTVRKKKRRKSIVSTGTSTSTRRGSLNCVQEEEGEQQQNEEEDQQHHHGVLDRLNPFCSSEPDVSMTEPMTMNMVVNDQPQY
jgi:hypothetical protein